MMKMDTLKNKIIFCLLIAIETIFCFTPLGSIPIGTIVATISMIPVIITSILFGAKYGMLMGFIFATYSFIYWTFIMPTYMTAFLFTPFAQFATYKGNFGSLIICFLPRIIAGFVPTKIKNHIVASAVSSMTNTILVMLFIFIFFRNEYEALVGKTIFAIIGLTIIMNGIPEAIICSLVCPIITKVIKKI